MSFFFVYESFIIVMLWDDLLNPFMPGADFEKFRLVPTAQSEVKS